MFLQHPVHASQRCCPVGEVREVCSQGHPFLSFQCVAVGVGATWAAEKGEEKWTKRHETRTLRFPFVKPLESILSNSSQHSQDSL